jgi:uncharacterized YigZ family protein
LQIISDTYKTISAQSEGVFKDKGSKFLSFAVPVCSVEEIKGILQDFRKQFFDARHLCYAYMLGAERIEFRANDDGEPSGTAGRPILGQINSNNLTNVLIVVVRYFGGTLLGTSGLITAYKAAAADAIANATVVEMFVEEQVSICFEYPLMNQVMKIVKDFELKITHQKFEIICEIDLLVRQLSAAEVKAKLADIEGLVLK